MPKSKRTKLISLTRTTTKGKEGKAALIERIRACFDSYKYLYVFVLHNERTSLLKDVRAQWQSSRFFLGKNKVMQIALGRTEEDEYKPNLHQLSVDVTGHCGLLFTNESEEDVQKFFADFRARDYARGGFVSTQSITLPKGPLAQFPHNMEPFLRNSCLMPTSLKNGVIHLERDFEVCVEGKPLTVEGAKILELLHIKMSDFRFELVSVWSEGEYKQLSERDQDE